MLLIPKLRFSSDLVRHKGGVWPQMSQSAFPSSSMQRGEKHFQSTTHLIIQKPSLGQAELQPKCALFSPLAMKGVKDNCRHSHWMCWGQQSRSIDSSTSALKNQIQPLKHFSHNLCHLSRYFPAASSHQLSNELVATGDELRLFLTRTVPAGTLPSGNKKEGLAQFRPTARISKGVPEHLTLT